MSKNTKTTDMCVECGALLDEDSVIPVDQNGTVLCGVCGRAQLVKNLGEYSNGYEEFKGGQVVEEPYIGNYLSEDLDPLTEQDMPALEQLERESQSYTDYNGDDNDTANLINFFTGRKIKGSKVKVELPRVKLVEDRAFIQKYAGKIRKVKGGKSYYSRGTIPRDVRDC